MKSLKEVILYFSEGRSEIPTLSYLDDKNASKEEKDKDAAMKEHMGTIRISNIDAEIESHLRKAEQRKRSFCFYPNGHVQRKDIKEIKWHFVDIDKGDKDEQFGRIMSAPLKPTLVYRGRAGHKFLYRVKDALWNTSSKELMDESEAHFKNIQQQLVEYFNGDGALITPNYPLRLPFTKNYKYWREEIVEEAIVFFDSNNVYSQKELSDAFPPAKEKHIVRETVTFEEYPNEIQEILETTVFCFETNDIDYTDRGDRLSFQCPVHDDSNSSAYMFKDNLMCFCSRGAADGGCEIGKGKPLGWVAEYLGWDDLKVLCDNIIGLSERKYLNISLNDMTANIPVALNNELNNNLSIVNPILSRIEETMTSRSNQVDIQTRQVYKRILGKFLSHKKAITVCPLEPGGGKSTLMETYLKCILENDISNAGCIIVVERIETAKELAEELDIYRTYRDGPGIDAPFWGPNQSAYVMESAFTFKKCKKKLISYEYGICRGCSERMTCPIPKKHQEQKEHPVLVITHARLKMESQSLDKYSEWTNIDGKEYKRNLIIIDEKPPLIEVSSLKLKDYDQFLYEVNSMGFDIEDAELEATKEMINQLREKTLALHDGELLKAVNPNFSFGFTALWYKKYHGNDVDLLKRIEFLIQNGGRGHLDQMREINVYINRVNKYNLDNFNTVILDGTSIIDKEYNVLGDSEMLDVPKIKSYEKLTFHIDRTLTLSKSKLTQNPSLIEQIANNIQIFTETDKVLILCYKNYEEQLLELLKDEVKRGKVLINHYGNVKGSNKYAECTVIVMVGIPHKGDPYYISKYEAIYGELSNIKTKTFNHVRRFQDLKLEIIKLNDQFVDAIQDISRIAIRNKGNNAAVKVFIPTKDSVFENLLIEYFEGAGTQKWLIHETYPDWYEPLKEIFLQLKIGEKIRKAEIKRKLGLSGWAGKKAFQRIQRDSNFKDLITSLGIKEFNNRTYIRDNGGSAVCDE